MEIEWDDKLLTGEEAVDKQHMAMFRAAATLHQAIEEKRGKNALRDISHFLETYIIEHFFMEERLMKKYQYPEARAAKHIQEHLVFKAEMKSLFVLIEKENYDPKYLGQLARRIAQWFAEHIYRLDMDLTKWVHERTGEDPRVLRDKE